MSDGGRLSPRRIRENEEHARKLNRRLEGVTRAIRVEDEPERDAERPAGFFCECADDGCRDRIPVRLDRYDEIHADPDRFVVVPGHEVPRVERVVERRADHVVVEKLVG